jgi:ribonuclease P protein component
MKKQYIVKHKYDFERIINKNNLLKSKYFIIYYEENDLKHDCFGISVGKKLGNAVFRNKMKRKIRSIIHEYMKNNNSNKNYIVLLRKNRKNDNYKELKEDFNQLLSKENNHEEKK